MTGKMYWLNLTMTGSLVMLCCFTMTVRISCILKQGSITANSGAVRHDVEPESNCTAREKQSDLVRGKEVT